MKARHLLPAALAIGVAAGTAWATARIIPIYVNGQEIEGILSEDGVTYVPLRVVAENLGCTVQYEGGAVYITRPGEGGGRRGSLSEALARNAHPPVPRSAPVYLGSGDEHWIDSVSDGGRIIILEDGSVWEVSPVDQVTSSIWLPVSDVVVVASSGFYPYRIINKDDGESVEARRLR